MNLLKLKIDDSFSDIENGFDDPVFMMELRYNNYNCFGFYIEQYRSYVVILKASDKDLERTYTETQVMNLATTLSHCWMLSEKVVTICEDTKEVY